MQLTSTKMDKEVLETFCKIAKKLSLTKTVIYSANINRRDYIEARDLLGDCLELMAIVADTSPANLISGKILNGR